ncbi:MAG TPA: tRNA (guanosine(37)-N1)-methyltransferase TrmD [Candidatus Absconditabacterales bacterium]|nr:tRNA (guanosine(37)-N1)-methyltransferase TrmD [Candidatus Absconditabacterales bacterium]
MKLYFISIFPEIFQSFLDASLIKKAQEKGILEFEIINPRDFCKDKHKQVDDEIYGGGAGMLIMAQPMIDAVNSVIEKIQKNSSLGGSGSSVDGGDFQIIFPTPSQDVRNQESAHGFSKVENLIFVCGRYEGIDHRFIKYFQEKYKNKFHQISMGKFITLGGEMPTMTMVESIVRLIPGVIKEESSRQEESYSPSKNMENIEYPQYTRPQEVEGYSVPEVLLSGDHKKIEERKNENSS